MSNFVHTANTTSPEATNASLDHHSLDPLKTQPDQENDQSGTLRFDAQEYIGLTEDDIVDYDTAEEFLLHFSRIGQLTFVTKLLHLRDSKEISLNIDCKGA